MKTNTKNSTSTMDKRVPAIFTFYLLAIITILLTGTCWGANSLSQFGITWTFDKELTLNGVGGTYRYGQFANGDYWVVGPVTIIGIDPPSNKINGRTKNGSMLNPDPEDGQIQGYDSGVSAASVSNVYDAGYNVALDVDAGSPLVLAAHSSLVSTISVDAAGSRPQIQTAAVLTVLSTAPAANSFRPPYCGSDKTINFNVSDLDYSKLSSLDSSGITNYAANTGASSHLEALHKDVLETPTSSWETVERMFERVRLDHRPGWQSRYLHPAHNMPDYAREMATQVGDAGLYLNLDFTNEQKETLLIRFVQLGLDLYGIIEDGGIDNWKHAPSQCKSRKLPILVAAIVLDDSTMQAMFAKTGNYLNSGSYGPENPPADYIYFEEDDTTFYVSADDIFTSPYSINTIGGTPQDSGTVDVVKGSKIVTGHDTGWSDPSATRYFAIVDGVEAVKGFGGYDFPIASWDSATQITLEDPYTGDTTNGASYTIAPRVWFGHGNYGNLRDYTEYTSAHLGMPDWGRHHIDDFFEGGLTWNAPYRAGHVEAGHALTAHIMGGKSLWNHNAFFDYQDRWMGIENSQFVSDFAADMWAEYRADYGNVWTAGDIPQNEEEEEDEDEHPE